MFDTTKNTQILYPWGRQHKIKNILVHTATATYTTRFYEWWRKNFRTYQTTEHTNTTQTTKTTTSSWVILLKLSLCSYNWDNANSGVFIFKICTKFANFVHFIHHQFCTLYLSPPKMWTLLVEQFLTFHSSLNKFVTNVVLKARLKKHKQINLFL